MVRRYDASRRKESAAQTRKAIVEAAMKLHWQGITEFEALAEEAGCSVATVRKYFPTKEAVYRDCTRTFAKSLTFPDLDALSKIRNRSERLRQCVHELCRIHEVMFGYAWHAAFARDTSPTLDAVMNEYAGLADAIVQIIAPRHSGKTPVIRGLLDFLSYRALRRSGDLPPEKIENELIAIIAPLAGIRD